MNLREIERVLERWQEHGLLSGDQAQAIVAFEAADQGIEPEEIGRGSVDVASVLAYGGVFVALLAMVGVHLAVMDTIEAPARFVLALLATAGAAGLAFVMSKAHGAAAADALGCASVVLVVWAVLQGCDATGLMEFDANDDPDRSVYLSLLLSMLAGGAAGWVLTRTVPAPLAALAAAGAFATAGAALGWLLTDRGTVGSQVAVLVGFALATLALVPNALGLERAALRFWAIGALVAANAAAFILAAGEGGVYEGLLLPYAIGTGVAAIVAKQRALLVFAAIFLYEYVGFVVFRTFGGAVAAIIVLALIGLGTALGGTLAQRGLGRGLFLRR